MMMTFGTDDDYYECYFGTNNEEYDTMRMVFETNDEDDTMRMILKLMEKMKKFYKMIYKIKSYLSDI